MIQRADKRGGVKNFEDSYSKGFKNVIPTELDADLNLLFDAWNNPSAPVGAAGGDLDGTYPNPTIASLAITRDKIFPKAVGSAEIDKHVVFGGASGLAHIAANSIVGGDIQANTIDASHLKPAIVGTAHLVDGAVTGPKILDGNVTDAKIVSLAWAKITGAPASIAYILAEANTQLDTVITGPVNVPVAGLMGSNAMQIGKGYRYMGMGLITRVTALAVTPFVSVGGVVVCTSPIVASGTGNFYWAVDVTVFVVDATNVWINATNKVTAVGAPAPPTAQTVVESVFQGSASGVNLGLVNGIQPAFTIGAHTQNNGNIVTRQRSVVYAA